MHSKRTTRLDVSPFGSHHLEGMIFSGCAFSLALFLGRLIHCLFLRGDSTVLSVYVITMENQDTNTLTEDDEKKSAGGGGSTAGLESKALVWRITTRKFDSAKPEWMYAQVAVNPETSYRVSLFLLTWHFNLPTDTFFSAGSI